MVLATNSGNTGFHLSDIYLHQQGRGIQITQIWFLFLLHGSKLFSVFVFVFAVGSFTYLRNFPVYHHAMLLSVRVKGFISIVFGEWLPHIQGLRDICLRGWGLGSPAVQQVLSHHTYIHHSPHHYHGGDGGGVLAPPTLPAISTTMFTIHDHHGDDIEIRACYSPPPGRLPSYFSAGSSSRGKSNQPTLIKCQMSHKYKTILLFLWLLS